MKTTPFRNQLLYLLLLTLAVLPAGCATLTRGFGTFAPDESVARYFQDYQMDPDINYYFSGSDVYPNAIMGLRKEYVLDNDLWRPIPKDPGIFNKMVEGMYYKASEASRFLHGFVMKSPEGRNLGVWYSLSSVKMRLKMGEGNKVIVFTPEQNVYYQDEGRGDKAMERF